MIRASSMRLALVASVVASLIKITGAWAAGVLPDTTRLLDLATSRSKIVLKEPYTFSFIEGTSINASWFSDCDAYLSDGVKPDGTDKPFQGAIPLLPGDYLSIDGIGHFEGSVSFHVTVHTQDPARAPRLPHFVLACAHNNYTFIKTSDPFQDTIADLRRALGWRVWVEGETIDAGPTITEARTSKAVAPTEQEQQDARAERTPAAMPLKPVY